jgi:homoserine/homoserine lactone efflux protein
MCRGYTHSLRIRLVCGSFFLPQRIMDLNTLFLFLLVAVLPAMSPGPAVLLALTNTLRHGRAATVWSAMGNALGLFVLGLAVAFGAGALMKASTIAFVAFKVLGAAYLIYLGIKLWRSGLAFDTTAAHTKHIARARLFAEAFLVAITNPKAILILVALLPPFLKPGSQLLVQALTLSAAYAVLCLANHLCVAFFADRLRVFLFNPKRMRTTQKVAGGSFIGFGLLLLGASR